MFKTLSILLIAFGPVALAGTIQTSNDDSSIEVRSDWGLSESTRQMLIQRCGECHSPGSDDRKARRALLDIADLAALRADFLIPGNPIDSDVYFTIEDGDMPPSRSNVHAPSKQEMALLHAWISGGAELSSSMAGANRPKPIEEQVSPAHFLARSHPIWVHFPLALIPVALLAAALARLLRKPELDLVAEFCTALALPAALFAVASGWLHAGDSSGGDGMIFHRWLGVATTVTCGAALVVRSRKGLFLLILALCTVIAGAAGHFGGRLTYGSDFFPW